MAAKNDYEKIVDEDGKEVELQSILVGVTFMACVQNGIGGTLAYFFEERDGISFPKPGDMKMLMLAIFGYVVTMYILMFRQGISTNVVNPKLINSTKPEHVAHFKNVARSFGNAQEQMPLFVTALAFYGGLVNPIRAGYLCMAYTVLLICYPFMYPNNIPSTWPRYFIIHYMLWAIAFTAYFHQ